jgi:hypothetical protein
LYSLALGLARSLTNAGGKLDKPITRQRHDDWESILSRTDKRKLGQVLLRNGQTAGMNVRRLKGMDAADGRAEGGERDRRRFQAAARRQMSRDPVKQSATAGCVPRCSRSPPSLAVTASPRAGYSREGGPTHRRPILEYADRAAGSSAIGAGRCDEGGSIVPDAADDRSKGENVTAGGTRPRATIT